jgi:sec-independent protein translocase protein TatB
MQPTIEIANMGMWDTLIIGVLALVVFGPRRLPEIGRQIGKLMYEVRKASNDFKFQMEEELRKSEESDRRAKEEERLRALAQSQVPNAGPGAAAAQLPDAEAGAAAAVPDGQFPTPSPYPGESVYPEVSPEEFQPAESSPPSASESAADEPPGRMAAPLELEASESQLSESSLGAPAEPESAGPTFRSYNTPESGAAEIPVGDTTPSSEQAHHG